MGVAGRLAPRGGNVEGLSSNLIGTPDPGPYCVVPDGSYLIATGGAVGSTSSGSQHQEKESIPRAGVQSAKANGAPPRIPTMPCRIKPTHPRVGYSARRTSRRVASGNDPGAISSLATSPNSFRHARVIPHSTLSCKTGKTGKTTSRPSSAPTSQALPPAMPLRRAE